MIPLPATAGKIFALFGLARSGKAAARAIAAAGGTVWAWDDSAETRRAAAADGMNLIDLHKCDWSKPVALVLSPGVPHTHPKPHPIAALAKSKSCPIIGDIELLAHAGLPARFIGITGTNGKSTTTSLIGHILKSAGRAAEVGGNLGTPALDLRPLGADGFYVLEMSSYQLDLTYSLRFVVAILLNITPDHIDRHGDLAGYVESKMRIFAGQASGDTAIVGVDDAHGEAILRRLRERAGATVVPISVVRAVAGGVHALDGRLIDDSAGRAEAVMDLAAAARLPGSHNWQNACAAYAATRALGLSREAIVAGLTSFPGLAHRQELVATIDGVRYINDSKATNADATGKALACYRSIYWIVGGRAKETGLDGLEAFYPRIAHAFLIGEAMERFAAALGGKLAFSRCGTLADATAAAHALAQREHRPEAVVLLSPACASFDQFANFEQRGDAFRELARALAAATSNDNGRPTRRRAQ